MPNADASLHLYQRTVDGDSNDDSLSIIASLIEPGQTLLDLGMGTGSLGQYLSQRHAIVADGVSLNPAEADIARAWYRHALVADLDRDDLRPLFGDQRYDCIVCADVLEHLKAPQNILAQCKVLLKPGGRLLTSVPNAGYCGLVAELVQGDFRYRPEGLLDNTHLRFFTRKSLQRFFDENGWATQSIKTTERSLLASEFQVAFDSLPPAVARHLLASPDALTYQFISVSQPADWADQTAAGPSASGLTGAETSGPANALFSAQVYLATQGQYDETAKLVAAGRIGDPRQTLVFDIPASAEHYTQVRFDPADRPGFFRLHDLHIRLPDGQVVWQWQAGQDPLAVLANAPHQHMLLSSPWEAAAGAQLLLHGDDPWVELPLAVNVLQKVSQSGARLEVCAGWPMSADYLQASTAINTLHQEIQHLSQEHAQLENTRLELQARFDTLRRANHDAQYEKQRVVGELRSAQREAQNEKQHLIGQLRSAQRESDALLGQFNQIALHLQSIEQSTLFRATRPMVHLKMRFDRLLGRAPKTNYMPQLSPQTQPVPVPQHPVDIIVPVYRGLEDTRCCLESVLAAPSQTAWRLIVINDCSPEPEVTEWLRAFAQRDPRIELLENPENLGFVATVNRGMALSQDNDVLLLNSDAEVANDWLDRIQLAAYSAPRVASVTPFSNNATIFSYPSFCKSNELPSGYDTASLDLLFAEHLAGQTVEVPTGVGFCMYIRRQCLDEVGLFDVDNFGKGYGEENDFCVRAQQAGWTHLHALDTFVRHAGGISFGDTKSAREIQAMETLRRMHPRYESDVHTYLQNDPARSARLIIDIARITTSGRPVILNVMHNREGGTLRHIQELAQQLGDQATYLRLSPAPGGVELRLEGQHEAFALHFALPQEQPRLLQTLRQLQVGHIHYHHLLGHAPDITELPDQLGVTHDFTAHDYYSYCPQISLTDYTDRYCGELGLDQCHQCLKRNPAPGGESIESWRARHVRLLSQARYLITPSVDAAQRMQRFVPTAHIQVVPHAALSPVPAAHPKPNPRHMRIGEPLKIVVLGALSKIKGADTLEQVAILAARHNIPVEFHLLGFA
ncbi:MAG: methyltransferase domain-containing protein, partial [Rhodoferax sp.]